MKRIGSVSNNIKNKYIIQQKANSPPDIIIPISVISTLSDSFKIDFMCLSILNTVSLVVPI